MNPVIEILAIALVGGLVYGLIKTLLEIAFPEFFGLDPDWYTDTVEKSESSSDSEPDWGIEVNDKVE